MELALKDETPLVGKFFRIRAKEKLKLILMKLKFH